MGDFLGDGLCVTHHAACDCREATFRRAIEACIARPMGVVPDIVYELYPNFGNPYEKGFPDGGKKGDE